MWIISILYYLTNKSTLKHQLHINANQNYITRVYIYLDINYDPNTGLKENTCVYTYYQINILETKHTNSNRTYYQKGYDIFFIYTPLIRI